MTPARWPTFPFARSIREEWSRRASSSSRFFFAERTGFFFGQKLLDHKKPGSPPQLPMSKNRRTNNSSFFGGREVSPLLPFMRDGGGCLCCPKFTDEEGGPQVLASLPPLTRKSQQKSGPRPLPNGDRGRKFAHFCLGDSGMKK